MKLQKFLDEEYPCIKRRAWNGTRVYYTGSSKSYACNKEPPTLIEDGYLLTKEDLEADDWTYVFLGG